MNQKKISARIELNPYSNKVLAVFKAKYDLKDKSEAINKFMEIFGEEIVDKESNDNYVKKVIETVNKHLVKYKDKKMSIEELNRLCEV